MPNKITSVTSFRISEEFGEDKHISDTVSGAYVESPENDASFNQYYCCYSWKLQAMKSVSEMDSDLGRIIH